MVFILSALWWIRGLWKLPDGRDWLWGNQGLVLMGRDIFSKSSIQFSVYGWGCVPSLLFGLRPNYGRGNGGFLQKDVQALLHSVPWPCSRPLSTHTSARDSWTLTGKSQLFVDHNKLWKILKEMGIPDLLTCLLQNLYASQEATVRTWHGTMDWFKIGNVVHQGCILSPCLFNLYADYLTGMPSWMKHKLESRLQGEISITSDM